MLQFKKDSIFTRNNKDKSEVGESLPGGVLAEGVIFSVSKGVSDSLD